MLDAVVNYRYNVRMPNATASVTELLAKIQLKHFDQIINGKAQILISPIYHSGAELIWQPLFDLDIKRCKSIKTMVANYRRLKSLMDLEHHIEITNNGVHVVYDVAFKLDDLISLEKIRERFKKLSLGCLDISSSVKDLPIFRVGSYREDNKYTMIPILDRFNEQIYVQTRKRASDIPINIFDSDKWHEIFNRYLFPKRVLPAVRLDLIMSKMKIIRR